MKNIILIILLSVGKLAFAQNLTFNQLSQLRDKNFASAEDFLVSKNWNFIKAYLPNEDIIGYGNYTHMSAQFSDGKTSIFIYYDENQPNLGRVYIIWNNKSKYNEYIASLKANKYNLQSSNVNEYNEIVKIYKNNSKTVQITSAVSYKLLTGEQFPTWRMLILNNKDFEINF